MPYTNLRIGRYSTSGMTYHITTVTKNRLPLFLHLCPARVVVCQLKALQDEGLAETLSYVLMPDHLHWLMTLRSGGLSGVIRLLKGRTARTMGYPIWQPNYHDHAVRKD